MKNDRKMFGWLVFGLFVVFAGCQNVPGEAAPPVYESGEWDHTKTLVNDSEGTICKCREEMTVCFCLEAKTLVEAVAGTEDGSPEPEVEQIAEPEQGEVGEFGEEVPQ